MRLVVTLENAQQAEKFSLFLLERGIENQLEARAVNQHTVWVFEEDDVPKAKDCLKEFQKNPNWTPSPSIVRKKHEEQLLKNAEEALAQNPNELNEENLNQNPLENESHNNFQNPQSRARVTPVFGRLTLVIVCACVLLYIWAVMGTPASVSSQGGEKISANYLFTKPYNKLIYEEPLAYQYASEFWQNLQKSANPEAYIDSEAAYQQVQAFQAAPYWHGYYETYFVPDSASTYALNQAFTKNPQFEQIAMGQIWRIFTPALLHANFFHILFNLIWFIFLGKQIEERLGFWRYSFFILFAAAITNTSQYLMSGPNFLGLSGVVMAQAGYIWMRQTVAAWEGYTIQKPTLYFLGFYVLVLIGIQMASFVLELTGSKGIAPNIANTAHVTGALVGVVLGRLNFLSAWRLGKLKK